MSVAARMGRAEVQRDLLSAILAERAWQEKKFPDQVLPYGTSEGFVTEANVYRAMTEAASESGEVTWRHVLLEEVYEALAETDVALLRVELVQVAAVCLRILEQIAGEQS